MIDVESFKKDWAARGEGRREGEREKSDEVTERKKKKIWQTTTMNQI